MIRTRLRPTLDYLHLPRDYVLDLFTLIYLLRATNVFMKFTER